MSRRSQAFAEGQQKFSWKLEAFEDKDGRQRHKAVCMNHPTIFGLGDSEEGALRAGQRAIEAAAEKADLGTGMLGHTEHLEADAS